MADWGFEDQRNCWFRGLSVIPHLKSEMWAPRHEQAPPNGTLIDIRAYKRRRVSTGHRDMRPREPGLPGRGATPAETGRRSAPLSARDVGERDPVMAAKSKAGAAHGGA
jgi:hypothetical protein